MSNKKLDLIKELAHNQKNTNNDKPSNKFDFLFKCKSIVIGFVAIIIISAFFFLSNNQEKQAYTTTDKQDISSTASMDLSTDISTPAAEILSASGYVVPRMVSTIAAEITGRITEIYIEEGQKVSKGDLIAKLDATLAITEEKAAIAQLASSQSLVDSLQAKYKKAKFIANSKEKLFKSGVVSKETYIQSKAEVEWLAADMAKAKNDVVLARIEIERRKKLVERHFLLSPFNGVITSKDAHPGEVISPASGAGGFTRTGIATIVDMNSLEVEVDINESNINKVFVGQKVNIILEAYPEKMFKGSVIAIIPSANKDKATIKVRIGFTEKEDIIFPNMAVKVDFFSEKFEQ